MFSVVTVFFFFLVAFLFLLSYRDDSEEVIQARHHYSQAEVDNFIYNLFDDAHVKVWFIESSLVDTF